MPSILSDATLLLGRLRHLDLARGRDMSWRLLPDRCKNWVSTPHCSMGRDRATNTCSVGLKGIKVALKDNYTGV
jgi:hypothetical protein